MFQRKKQPSGKEQKRRKESEENGILDTQQENML